MVNVQEWIEQKYSKLERIRIKELLVKTDDDEKLEGSLDLSDFINLEILDVSNHQLTELDLTNCLNLQELHCSSNHLTSLNLGECKNLKLLRADNNKLGKFLHIIKDLKNLEELSLEGVSFDTCDKENKSKLALLSELKKLFYLNISSTNANNGLEYLPTNVENFYCKNCPSLEKELVQFAINREEGKYNLQSWQVNNQEKINLFRAADELGSIQNDNEIFFSDWKTPAKENLAKTNRWANCISYLFPTSILSAAAGGTFLSFAPTDIFSVDSVGGFSSPSKNPYSYVSICFYLLFFCVFATSLWGVEKIKEAMYKKTTSLFVIRNLLPAIKRMAKYFNYLSLFFIGVAVIGTFLAIKFTQMGGLISVNAVVYQLISDKAKKSSELLEKELSYKEKELSQNFFENFDKFKTNQQHLFQIFRELSVIKNIREERLSNAFEKFLEENSELNSNKIFKSLICNDLKEEVEKVISCLQVNWNSNIEEAVNNFQREIIKYREKIYQSQENNQIRNESFFQQAREAQIIQVNPSYC